MNKIICPPCNKKFFPLRKNQKYCSTTCRNADNIKQEQAKYKNVRQGLGRGKYGTGKSNKNFNSDNGAWLDFSS